MEIIVCAGQIIDPASREIDPLSGAADKNRQVYISCPQDLLAVEEALRLRQIWGGRVTVISLAPPRGEDMLRQMKAMGADEVLRIWGWDWPGEAEPALVSYALARLIRQRPYDLILCGDRGDRFHASQVPAHLAHALGLPLISGVCRLTMEMAGQGTATRILEKGRRQVLQWQGPAVLAVARSEGEPRDASLPARLEALTMAVPTVEYLFSTMIRQRQTIGPRREWKSQIEPLRPQGQVIFTPEAGLSGRERISQIVSGGFLLKHGQVVRGTPAEGAEALIRFLAEKTVIKKRDQD